MTSFLKDILAQPERLTSILTGLQSQKSQNEFSRCASLLQSSNNIFVVGIGASYHAALALCEVARQAKRFIHAVDAGEFLLWESLPTGSVVLALSRSGGSAEMVEGVKRARSMGAKVIAVTNHAESDMAKGSDIVVATGVPMDKAISVTTYTGLAMAGALVLEFAFGVAMPERIRALETAIKGMEKTIPAWSQALEQSDWLAPHEPFALFLGRGESLASAIETRLLWEEGAKVNAAALSTGAYRHGPQETVRPGLRVGLWLPRDGMFREGDLILFQEMREQGVKTMLIGERLRPDLADMVFDMPETPSGWSWLIDVVPGQLAAEKLANLRGENCDGFKYSAHVVRSLVGLRPDAHKMHG